jgi:hypothetical protein
MFRSLIYLYYKARVVWSIIVTLWSSTSPRYTSLISAISSSFTVESRFVWLFCGIDINIEFYSITWHDKLVHFNLMPTLKVTKQKLPDYIYIASFINFDDLFCIPYLGICVFFDWCTIFVQKFIGQALWKEKEQLNHEFNTKLPTPTLVNISFKFSLQIVILFPRWLLLSFSTNCYFLPFSYNGHTWPTGRAGLAWAWPGSCLRRRGPTWHINEMGRAVLARWAWGEARARPGNL